MSLPCKKCCKIEHGLVVARSEKGKRFEVLNKERSAVKVCRVDGCLLQAEGKKCDYLFLMPERAVLVELKGKDRNRALLQLLETAEKLESKNFPGRVESYIVTSRVPSMDTTYQKSLKKLNKRFRNAKCSHPQQKNLRISIVI